MAKVFLHTRDFGKMNLINEFREFARIPIVGEYLALSTDSEWYKVTLVVHCPFECECDAEVYATKADANEVMKENCKDVH